MHRILGKPSRNGLMMVAASVFAATAFASVTWAAPAQVEARKAAMAYCDGYSGQMASTCKKSQMSELRAEGEGINADYKTCLDSGRPREDCKTERDDDWREWTAGL